MVLIRDLVRNIASNWVGYCVNVAVAFVLTPYVLHSLGDARYGIWTLVVGLTGYYGLFDLGFSAGINQYLTRYLARKDIAGLNRTASTGVVTLTICGFLVFLATLVIAMNASSWFQIPRELIGEAKLVMIFTGASAAIGFAFTTYGAVFLSVQRFDLSNAIGIVTRLMSAAATLLCLKFGYGLVGLSFVIAAANLTDYLVRWYVSKLILPVMKVSYKLANFKSIGEVMGFGVWNLVITGSVRLVSYTDALVIGAFMPVSAIAPFAIAASLRTYFDDVFARASWVFFPAATELDAQGNQRALKELYLVSSRLMLLGSILFGTLAICWARDFFRLWVGMANAEPVGYPSIAMLFYLLVLGAMASVGQRIGYQVLVSIRLIRVLAILFVIEGTSNLGLSVGLVQGYGLLGVALGTLIPATICQGVLQPIFVCRALKISFLTYSRQVILRPAIVTLALAPVFISFTFLQPMDGWSSLLLWTLLSLMMALPIVVLVGLTRTERSFLWCRIAPLCRKIIAVMFCRPQVSSEPVNDKSL